MRVLLVNTNRMKPAVAPIGLDYLADSGTDTRFFLPIPLRPPRPLRQKPICENLR